MSPGGNAFENTACRYVFRVTRRRAVAGLNPLWSTLMNLTSNQRTNAWLVAAVIVTSMTGQSALANPAGGIHPAGAVALNPQPIPPGRGSLGALNPQPIPPGRTPIFTMPAPLPGSDGAPIRWGGTPPQVAVRR